MEREFLGIWIPKEIYLHKELTPTEKLLMAEIMSFSKNGVCFASNEHFAEFLGISKSHVSRLVGKLVKLKLVTVDFTYKENSKEIDKRIISPTLKQENAPVPVITQEQTPILIEADTPLRTDAYTPTHESVDPLCIEAHTPTHGCVDPLRMDAYDKEQYKIQDKIQVKEQDKTHTQKKKRKNNIPLSTLELEFERLWDIYPKKKGKEDAKKKYIKLRKENKLTYEAVENGLYRYLRYIEQHETEERYIPYGSTWFNQHRWEDECVSIVPKKKIRSYMDLLHSDFGGGDFHEHGGNTEIIDHNTSYFPYS
jgi:DNA-binding MarR family transcriptional regulator